MISPKPLPIKKPLPKQRPESAKRMTIIFGILQSDSVILAADTEETGFHLKRSVPKLYSYGRDNGESLIIGGAGSAFSIDTLEQRLGKSFVDDSASFANIAPMLIKEFYDQFVVTQDMQDERPEYNFSLLLGLSLKTIEGAYAHHLQISEHGTLRDAGDNAAIGAGAEIAYSLLNHYKGDHRLLVEELIAIHILRLVKEQAQYCGKESMVWSVQGPNIRKMGDEHATKAEHLSVRFEDECKKIFFSLFDDAESLENRWNGLFNSSVAALNLLHDEYKTLADDLSIGYSFEEDFDEYMKTLPPEG